MKVLVGITNNLFSENSPYEMCTLDTDDISKMNSVYNNWKDVNLDELKECVNIQVDDSKFRSSLQDPSEYIKASYDVKRLIGMGLNQRDYQVTNVYYDENGNPQLYRTVNSSGIIAMHDISEFSYSKRNSVLGNEIEKLPEFVKREPLIAAYNWWKEKDKKGKESGNKLFSGQFDTYEDMPVKLLYHYLIGVKGFKVGYHTQTKIDNEYSSKILHEYLLYKDTANIQLTESIPVKEDQDDFDLFYGYGMFGRESDIYPDERKLKYYGAHMSVICNLENYPKFDIYNSPSFGRYDENGLSIDIDGKNRLMSIYNKLEESGCIFKDWRLNYYGRLDAMDSLLPNELLLLGTKLQAEKEETSYNHVMMASHGPWSTFKTNPWIEASSLALAAQFYSPEFMEELSPVFQNYSTLYTNELRLLIEEMGAKDALEVMNWTKENAKDVLNNMSFFKPDNTLQKASVDVVDQLSDLYTYKRNNYPLPEWAQIYSKETIEALGGVDLLQELIAKRGEKFSKEFIVSFAEEIESEKISKLRSQGQHFVQLEEIITKYNNQSNEKEGAEISPKKK